MLRKRTIFKKRNTKFIDETGNTYGHWTVLCQAYGDDKGNRQGVCWWCRCVCGKEKIQRGCTLRQNLSKSCGCKADKRSHMIGTEHAKKHGLSRTQVYNSWNNMIQTRKVCEKWQTFEGFFEEMGAMYAPGDRLTFNREYLGEEYSTETVSWVPKKKKG